MPFGATAILAARPFTGVVSDSHLAEGFRGGA